MIPEMNRIYHGDHTGKEVPAILKDWPENFVDAVVCDPPYELGFMGKKWDSSGIAYSVEMWRDVLRVMKPGAHLLAFGGTRTYHRMACAIEDAGFEIRDQLQWLYGSGFPKSLDVSKAIDKANGDKRPVLGRSKGAASARTNSLGEFKPEYDRTAAASAAWEGWGTALKPANEPVCLARKPLSEPTVAANVLRWGTGALNIEAGRIGDDVVGWGGGGGGGKNSWKEHDFKDSGDPRPVEGRWPANVLFDRYAAGVLDGKAPEASRFFYVAKPNGEERNMGLEDEPARKRDAGRQDGRPGGDNPRNRGVHEVENFHPTVKPVDLMSYIIQLVAPPRGIVLDHFAGSGTTGIAAALLGHPFLGIEKDLAYIQIANKRIAAEASQGKLL